MGGVVGTTLGVYDGTNEGALLGATEGELLVAVDELEGAALGAYVSSTISTSKMRYESTEVVNFVTVP